MKNYRVIAAGIAGIVVLIGGILLAASLTTIHPGHVGVSVRKCGGGGVSSNPIPTGYYWRSLFCEDVVEYPTSVQTLVLSKSPHEGMSIDESITVTSSEGLPVSLDVSVSFTLEPAKVPAIYTKYRNDISVIAHNFVRQTIREGLQSIFAQFTAEQLYSTKREESRLEVQAFLSKHLGIEGFVIQQFTVNETRVPDAVVQAINAKVAMIQDAQKTEQETRKIRALAEQKVAAAEGDAKAKRAMADAEAYYNKTVAGSVTAPLIQYKTLEVQMDAIRKWNGTMPYMTGGAVPFINMSGVK
jgi:regulator of protease activity HflC (stomatin/prohibitin superfamily)